MTFENYVALPGSEREPMIGGARKDSCNPDEAIEITVVLRQRPSSHEVEALAEIAGRGERLTPEEYEVTYGADPQDVQQVKAFAQANYLRVSGVNLAARTVQLSGTVERFCRAFRVDLVNYEYGGETYRCRAGGLFVPAEFRDIISAVLGLDNRPQARPHCRILDTSIRPAPATAVSYTPLQVAELYNFPSGFNGQGETIGIIELGGGYTQSDLDTYFSGLGISPSPAISWVSVDGGQNQPTGNPNGPDAEVMLDIEVAGAVAPSAKMVVYFSPNTDAGFLNAINQAVTDKQNRPSVVSISWGGPESTWTAQSLTSYNNALQAASVMGVTVCVASGDNGSTDGVADGQEHVDFPASSPYALACGGTHLIGSSHSITDEQVWNDLPNGGATGGGVSATFPLPPWQAKANVPPSANPGHFKGRGLPDVAGDADPLTGYRVDVDGSNSVVGGTSAVAPLWAGLIALFNQATAKSVGYFNPSLYQQVSAVAGTFHDITSGNNGSYHAGPGWDPCTGWGSPDGGVILPKLPKASGVVQASATQAPETRRQKQG